MARHGNIQTTPHRKHIRHQRFDRLKQDSRFYDFLQRMGIKFEVTANSIRDALRDIGPFYPRELEETIAPPVPGIASITLIGAGTDFTADVDGSGGPVMRFDNATATFLTNGFVAGMTVSVEAGGPTFNPGEYHTLFSGNVRNSNLSETTMKIAVKEGEAIPTGSTQIGDVVRISQISPEDES